MDPLAGSPWSAPATVAGFAQSAPNDALMRFAASELPRAAGRRLLDLGCGAGRNAIPLTRMGYDVLGLDLSWPMLGAAAGRAPQDPGAGRLRLALAPMDGIPVRNRCIDFVVAHGIWNLAPSAAVFRNALREAARVARPGAALFVFTFSRNTLPPQALPVAGEPFVFTQFSGKPQCFLTEPQLVAELGAAGFVLEPSFPLKEYNHPTGARLLGATVPAIYEGVFRRHSATSSSSPSSNRSSGAISR